MSFPRLSTRLAKVEAQWRPKQIAAILARVRQCAPADFQSALLDVVTTVSLATAEAIMEQLTEAELTALLGPELGHYLDTLAKAEFDALAKGNPAVTRKVQRWIRSEHHQGDLSR